MSEYSIVITTTDSQEAAEKIIAAVMERRLAACVQVFPVVSHYIWKDKLQKDDEILLQMKMRSADFSQLCETIRSAHTYETPEIIRIEIAEGSRAYLEWIETVTRREGPG